MLDEQKYNHLKEEDAVAYFNAGLCLEDPDNYSLEEKKALVDNMAASDAAIDEAIREDFQSLTPEQQKAMMDMLTKGDPELGAFFKELLG